jgi:hypothetical protein
MEVIMSAPKERNVPKPEAPARYRLAPIVERLVENTSGLCYGTAAVSLRFHDGRIVDITYTVTESQKEHLGQ